ncbi:MAG TPA: hypothetical protein VFQ75_12440 [Candidatus Limnocylindrales bacterium]|nr:hypothetical protein [Candidatus Limnocylindrales bacterium]
MHRLIVVVAAVGVIGGTLVLGFALAAAGPGACPTALMQGRLVEREGTLAVESIPGGAVVQVAWPFGYGVERRDGALTLTRVFLPVATAGDEVSLGGGDDGRRFVGCGPVVLGLTFPPAPSPESVVPATLRVAGTAFDPCIPPPSGCGYWVTVASDAGTHRARLQHHRSDASAANGDPAPLTLGEGLPASLNRGVYELDFEVGEYSDADPVGASPRTGIACHDRVDVSESTARVSVTVTYRGSLCTVEVTYLDAMH